MQKLFIETIISGGQTGVDRAALDFAIDQHISHGGWCPKGRKAEDGILSEKYHLKETPSAEYEERTLWNVRDSDGTLIILRGLPNGGTLFTIEAARELKKPFFIVDLSSKEPHENNIFHWVAANNIQTLNIAGPRASKDNDIYQAAYTLLHNLFCMELVT